MLYVRRRFLQKDALREAIRRVVNATLTARLPEIWGEVTTACASDAKHYGVWDQNLMTEYHARYRKAGVTIYWHTDKRAACVYSQAQALLLFRGGGHDPGRAAPLYRDDH